MDTLFDSSAPVLRLPVPCTQEKYELETLIKFLNSNSSFPQDQPKIIEVGAFLGGTVYAWAKHLGNNPQIGVVENFKDIYKVQFPVPGFDKCPNPSEIEALWQTWGNVRLFHGDSIHVLFSVRSHFDDADFCFIDGDHELSAVIRDYSIYSDMVAENGFIALHDIQDCADIPENQVQRFWEHLKRMGNTTWEFKASSKWMGIGVIQKDVNFVPINRYALTGTELKTVGDEMETVPFHTLWENKPMTWQTRHDIYDYILLNSRPTIQTCQIHDLWMNTKHDLSF